MGIAEEAASLAKHDKIYRRRLKIKNSYWKIERIPEKLNEDNNI